VTRWLVGRDVPIVAALLLLAAAVWLPPVTLQRPTWSTMVTFDITQSMYAEDVADAQGRPTSRLALAKAAMRDALRRLPCGSRVGWSVFADYRALPLILPVEVCAHHEDLLASLERIDGRMRWANASNIGKGVTWTIRSAQRMGKGVSVLFFTDGHEAPPLRDVETLPPTAGITPGEVGGWLIGVGGRVPARIPKVDREGRPTGYWAAGDVVQRAGGVEHLSELRETHLQALAEGLGFGYRRLDGDAVRDALLDPALAVPAPVPTDLRWLPGLAAVLLLAWRFRPQRRA
jgi:mxaL protein